MAATAMRSPTTYSCPPALGGDFLHLFGMESSVRACRLFPQISTRFHSVRKYQQCFANDSHKKAHRGYLPAQEDGGGNSPQVLCNQPIIKSLRHRKKSEKLLEAWDGGQNVYGWSLDFFLPDPKINELRQQMNREVYLIYMSSLSSSASATENSRVCAMERLECLFQLLWCIPCLFQDKENPL